MTHIRCWNIIRNWTRRFGDGYDGDFEGVKNMEKKEIEFEFERATKNTYRFQEKSSGSPVIGTLYVQKSVFGSKEPKKVKVTVEWD
jgi:hypothetical protein